MTFRAIPPSVNRMPGPLNPHSGKWNHYTSDPPTAEDVRKIARRVWEVLPDPVKLGTLVNDLEATA